MGFGGTKPVSKRGVSDIDASTWIAQHVIATTPDVDAVVVGVAMRKHCRRAWVARPDRRVQAGRAQDMKTSAAKAPAANRTTVGQRESLQASRRVASCQPQGGRGRVARSNREFRVVKHQSRQGAQFAYRWLITPSVEAPRVVVAQDRNRAIRARDRARKTGGRANARRDRIGKDHALTAK